MPGAAGQWPLTNGRVRAAGWSAVRRAMTTSATMVSAAGAMVVKLAAVAGHLAPPSSTVVTVAVTSPYSSEPASTPVGRQAPKYTSAMAMKPIWLVRLCWKIA